MPSTISSSQQYRVAFVDEDMVVDKDTDEVKHKGKTEDDGTGTTPSNLYGRIDTRVKTDQTTHSLLGTAPVM